MMEDLLRMNCVIGLDLSLSSTGMVGVTDEGEVLHPTSIPTDPQWELPRRIDCVLINIESVAKKYDIDLWVIEAPSFAPTSIHTAVMLAKLGGCVEHLLWREKQATLYVPPSQLKLFTCGKGDSSKNQMGAWVHKRWGFIDPSDDVIDAYALARLGLAYLGHTQRLEPHQMDVLAKLRGEKPTKKRKKVAV